MLITLGRSRYDAGLIELLIECHTRIRHFAKLAEQIAVSTASADEVQQACRACERYFVDALPLHVADEEETLLPRLRDKEAALTQALQRMHNEHHDHQPLLDELVRLLQAVASNTADAAVRSLLATHSATIARAFELHLELEESILFPAIRRLMPSDEQRLMMIELRERRALRAGAHSTPSA